MTRVAIFDYGAGNIFSLRHSLERAGAQVDVIADFEEPNTYAGLLLPGVGHFDPAVRSIGSGDGFAKYVDGMPVLGICLGMEIFFEASQEGDEPGLGVMGGDVAVLPPSMKVPHMGWNSLEVVRPCRLLDGIEGGSWVYFVHSYMARPDDPAGVVAAESDYGIRVPAVVEQDNLFGTQFHPEKSGSVGRQMIENFLGVCKR